MNNSAGPPPDRDKALPGWPLLVIALSAFIVVFPFLVLGIPAGHDFDFHMNCWIEVLGEWRQGILYPQWAALAQFGYGEARYIFYPPVSWTLGAVLGAILPWQVVPGVFVWIALTLSGISMFMLARRWMDGRRAMLASALYAMNPYYVVIVYWRSAYAELLAGALLPALLLCMLKLEEEKAKAVTGLGLIVAGAALINVPTSVMVNYSIALLAVALAIFRRSSKLLVFGAVAGLLGTALAAFYLLPAWHEAKWVNIAQVLSAGVRPQDNFLLITTTDADHDRFNRLMSVIALMELIVTGAAAWFSNLRRNRPRLWRLVAIWGAVTGLLMFSITHIVWAHLPLLQYVQLPWRWLLCLNLILAILVSTIERRWMKIPAALMMLGAVIFVWRDIQAPWWNHTADIADMVEQQRTGAGYEGVDEYVPAGADPYNVKADAPKIALVGGGDVKTGITRWGPQKKQFKAEADRRGMLIVRLFNYPAWRVAVNGKAVKADTKFDTGQMLIPVEAGTNKVEIRFARTWDRTLGETVSVLTVAGFLYFHRRRRRQQGL